MNWYIYGDLREAGAPEIPTLGLDVWPFVSCYIDKANRELMHIYTISNAPSLAQYRA